MSKKTTTTPSTSNSPRRPRQIGGVRTAVPARWRGDLKEVLITEEQLERRVAELARLITREYSGKDLSVVALLNGTVVFLADLLRRVPLPLRLDFIGVSAYAAGTEPKELVFTKELRMDIRDRDVLVIDDILDTGRTLDEVQRALRALKPKSIKTCVLLDKPSRRRQEIRADFVGFVIPDLFVVGYGLDYAERYRNFPFIGVLHPEFYRP